MSEKSFRASDGTTVVVRWTPVKGPSPGVQSPEVWVNGQSLPLDSTLADGRRLTVRWPTYGDPDVVLAGSMLEGSASHPLTTILRARGVLAFGAVLLAFFAMGGKGKGLPIQIAFAAGWGLCAAIAKPFPRAALALSAFAIVAASGAFVATLDLRGVLVIPIVVLWFAGVRPMAKAARQLG
ncbi:MAG: hypothetical protein ACXVEF_26045 [Polyangiales bacterium]